MSALTDITSAYFELTYDDLEKLEELEPLIAAQMHKGFKSSEHPRDNDGKFTKKGLGVGQVAAGAKPIKINTKVVYNTKYADGAVVAEHPDPFGPRRLRWSEGSKKFLLQTKANGYWSTTAEYGKGEAYKKFKDESGWVTPTAFKAAVAQVPKKAVKPKDVKLKGITSLNDMTKQEFIDWFGETFMAVDDGQAVWDSLTLAEQGKIANIADDVKDLGASGPMNAIEKLNAASKIAINELQEVDPFENAWENDLITSAPSQLPPFFMMTGGELRNWAQDLTQEKWDSLSAVDKQKVGETFGDLGVKWAIDKINVLGKNKAKVDISALPADEFIAKVKSLTGDEWNALTFDEKIAIINRDTKLATGAHDDSTDASPFLVALIDAHGLGSQPKVKGLPNFDDMTMVEVDNYYSNLTQDEWDGFDLVEQQLLIETALEHVNDLGNPIPYAKLTALSDISDKGDDTLHVGTQLKSIDAMSKNEFHNWIYENVTPELLESVGPGELLWTVAAKHGLTETVNELGELNEPVYDNPLNTSFTKNLVNNAPTMSTGQFNAAYDVITPAMWETFSPEEQKTLTDLADEHSSTSTGGQNFGPWNKVMQLISTAPKVAPPAAAAPIVWPKSMTDLKFTGKTVGTHGSKIYRDVNTGDEFLFKPNPGAPFATEVDVATAKLRAKLGLPGPRVEKVTLEGTEGSLQEMLKGDLAFPGKSFKPADLSSDDILALQKEHALDWLISNHDSHPANFIKTPDGALVGIDKGQSFKYFGWDKLDWNFHPNAAFGENEPVYNTLHKAYVNGDVEIHGTGITQPFGEFLDLIKDIPDQQLKELFRPYAEAAVNENKLAIKHNVPDLTKVSGVKANDVDAFLNALVKRKNSIPQDFFALQIRAVKEKEDKQAAKSNFEVKIAHESVTAPATQTPVQTAYKPKSMKINTAVIYKTKYAHGAVVAQTAQSAAFPAKRLVWHEAFKKFVLQKQYGGVGWANAVDEPQVTFGKGEAYKIFSGQSGWLTPDPNATAIGTSTFGGVAPKISSPTTPSALVVKDDPEAGKFSTFDADSLQQLHGVPPSLSIAQVMQLYQIFKNQSDAGVLITLKSKPVLIFNSLVYAVELFNKNNSGVKLNYLQALKLIDEKSTPGGSKNKNLYEKIVVDWLQTSDGKAIAPQAIHNKKLVVTDPPKGSTHASVASKLAELKAPSDIGKPSTTASEFTNLPVTSAAAMHKKMQTASPWNATQVNALKSYTGSSYGSINGMLRSNSGTSVNTAKMAVDMQSAMRPVPQSFLVHRGTVLEQFGKDVTNASQLKHLVGATVDDKGFVSTSVGGQAAFSSNPVMLEIEVPKGAPGAYVKSISQHSSENEFILAAGTKFKILSVATTGYHTVVRMRVIP